MKKLTALAALAFLLAVGAAAVLTMQPQRAQSAPVEKPTSLVLLSWTVFGDANQPAHVVAPSQTVIGTFNSVPACQDAIAETPAPAPGPATHELKDALDPLVIAFVCVPAVFPQKR